MAKKFKKDNKIRKDQHQQINPEKLIDQGKAFLEKGKARDAIEVLKQAAKKQPDSDMIRHLLYQSYLLREAQLRSKGLIPEANAVRKLAIGVMPPVDLLSEAEVLDMIACASVEDALKLSADFSKNRPLPPRFHQQVAYRLMMTDDWKPLERLQETHPLRREAQTVQNAVSLMNLAKWEEAIQVLKSVPRQSPYASINLFCRAMVLFYEKKDDELMQTLSRIPDDFPLAGCIESIRQVVGRTSDSEPSSRPIGQSILWGDGGDPDQLAADILVHLKNGDVKNLSAAISRLAKIVFPPDRVIAAQQILEIILFSPQRNGFTASDFVDICSSLLSRNRTELVTLKSDIEFLKYPVETIVKYLEALEQEISDIKSRNMASGMVLLYAAKQLHARRFSMDMFNKISMDDAKRIGLQKGADGVYDVIIGMVSRAIELDPQNREAYEFILEQPRYSHAAKETIETLLLKMSAEFPDDPFPCLELATLYYQKNAFRKAEKVLDEAAVRAPHDNRVLDRRALALVISASKSMNHDRLHLVAADLEKAEGFNSKWTSPILAEKKILFDLLSHPERIQSLTADFCPEMSVIERLRVMGLLIQDMENYRGIRKSFSLAQIGVLKKWLSQELNRLKPTPTDVVSLLSPFPKEYQMIIPNFSIAASLLEIRNNLFEKIPDAELLSIFELLFDRNLFTFMAEELQKRLKNRKKPQALPLQFFLITIGHIGNTPWTTQRYGNILSGLDEASRNELKALSSRLAKHAHGHLKLALESFDFTILELSSLPFSFPGFNLPDFMEDLDDDDFDEDEFDEDDWDDMDEPESLEDLLPQLKELKASGNIKELNELVKGMDKMMLNEMNIRRMPDGEIRLFRSMLRSNPSMREMLDAFGSLIKMPGIAGVSREVHVLLTGKSPKK